MAKTLADKILNPSQKLWMETIYSKLKNNEPFNRKSLKVELSNQLPKGFNPKDISHRLLRNDTELTLLGTALINPKSYMVGKADKVIQTISNLLKTDSETDKITSQEISQKTKISESDVGAILQMLSEIGYYHTGGIIGDNNDLSAITIDDKTFDRYIEYPNFKECLDAVIEDIKYPKDNNSFKLGFPSILESKIEANTIVQWDLLHPTIIKVSRSLFESNHFADSVLAAMKEVNAVLKAKVLALTGKELDGAKLMQNTFSSDNPVLLLGDINTQIGKDLQLGYQQIFTGAIIGVRNPKAHENLSIDENRAIHLLFLASLLMHKIDEAIKPIVAE